MVSRRVQALLDQLRAQGIQDEQVLNALAAVPREKFVDEAFEQKAWDNIALPIGQGQTISQPYMVARMTELLELTPQSRVLEIGTGSGYQTAILAHLVQHVCSVERIKGLQWQARRRLKNLDLHNVSTRHGDGWQGWQARAPFDAIIVTAAPPEIPTEHPRGDFHGHAPCAPGSCPACSTRLPQSENRIPSVPLPLNASTPLHEFPA